MLEEMVLMEDVTYPRRVKPARGKGGPEPCGWRNGGRPVSAACFCARYELGEAGSKGETVSGRLLMGQARIALSPKIEERPRQATPQTSPPRDEEFGHNYSTNVFLIQSDQFVAMRDRPTRVTSDPGRQLTASLNTVKIDDWEQTEGWEMEQDAAWEFVPAGCQWRNNLAESRVKASKVRLKRTLVKMLRGEDPTPSHNELCAILATGANVASDLPTTLGSRSSNNFMSLALKHLLLGRNSVAPLEPQAIRTSITSEPADTCRTA